MKIPDLAQALEGSFEEHHARMAKAILNRLDLVEQSLADLDVIIRDQCAPWAHEIELLQTIPGVGERVAQVIIAETGGDMSRFPSAAHLAAWAGVAPGIHESAGKRTPTGSRHGNKWLTSMLVEAAGSVARMHGKNYLAAQHARLSRRRGAAGRRSPSRTASWSSPSTCSAAMSPTATSGADWHNRRDDAAHTRRLVAQLEHLGHTVHLDAAS